MALGLPCLGHQVDYLHQQPSSVDLEFDRTGANESICFLLGFTKSHNGLVSSEDLEACCTRLAITYSG